MPFRYEKEENALLRVFYVAICSFSWHRLLCHSLRLLVVWGACTDTH